MRYLLVVTFIWAFSFSLIGVYLAGQVDSYFAVLVRVFLATLVFLPFLKKVSLRFAFKLMFLGSIQLGLMYVFYYQSFLILSVPEVLLFTVLTPVYVTLISDILKFRFSFRYLVTAICSVLGAVIIRYHKVGDDFFLGFLIVQGANFCFALGQVGYKILLKREKSKLSQLEIFGWFYIGALIISILSWLFFGSISKLPTTYTQWGVLIYLGIIASGLGYFWWNKGATLVDAGVLAIMNNALIPAGLIVNLLIWNKDADILRLFLGGSILFLSLILHEKWGN